MIRVGSGEKGSSAPIITHGDIATMRILNVAAPKGVRANAQHGRIGRVIIHRGGGVAIQTVECLHGAIQVKRSGIGDIQIPAPRANPRNDVIRACPDHAAQKQRIHRGTNCGIATIRIGRSQREVARTGFDQTRHARDDIAHPEITRATKQKDIRAGRSACGGTVGQEAFEDQRAIAAGGGIP